MPFCGVIVIVIVIIFCSEFSMTFYLNGLFVIEDVSCTERSPGRCKGEKSQWQHEGDAGFVSTQ